MEIIFPIRGHSFIPRDGLFGIIEREFKNSEEIENPQEYLKIIQNYSTVVGLGEECDAFDWKTESKSELIRIMPIANCHIKFAHCTRYLLKRSAAMLYFVAKNSTRMTSVLVFVEEINK